MTAHRPVAHNDPKVADLKRRIPRRMLDRPLRHQAHRGDDGRHRKRLMPLILTSNRPGQTFVAPIDLFLGGQYTPQTASGTGILPPTG